MPIAMEGHTRYTAPARRSLAMQPGPAGLPGAPSPSLPAATAAAPSSSAAIPLQGLDPARVAALDLTLPTGHTITLPVAEAVRRGLVAIGPDGRLRATLAGRNTHVRINAGPARAAVLGAEAATTQKPEKPASEKLVDLGRAAMFARGALTIAKGPGLPAPISLYFFANSANKYSGNKLLPEWIQKGPVRDLIDFGIVGKMWVGSWKALPGATRQFQSALSGARQASGGVSALGAAKALFSRMPAEAAAATKSGPANIPALAKLFPLIKPLTTFGFSMYAGSSILGLPEHIQKHGTSGLLNTRSGRGAVLGAIDGAMMLAVMYLPQMPATIYADFASNTAWLLGLLNEKGVFDSILGGDPDKAPKDAPSGNVPVGTSSPAAALAPAQGAATQQQTAGLQPGVPVAGSTNAEALAQLVATTSRAAAQISETARAPRARRRGSQTRR